MHIPENIVKTVAVCFGPRHISNMPPFKDSSVGAPTEGGHARKSLVTALSRVSVVVRLSLGHFRDKTLISARCSKIVLSIYPSPGQTNRHK